MKTTVCARPVSQDEKRRLFELAIAAAVSRMLHLGSKNVGEKTLVEEPASELSLPG